MQKQKEVRGVVVEMKRISSVIICLLVMAGCSSGGSNPSTSDISQQDARCSELADSPDDMTEDLRADLTDLAIFCPDGQVAYADGCGPALPEVCPAGHMLLPSGTCGAVGPRGCPTLWDPQSTVECEAGAQLECPEGTVESDDGSYCMPLFDSCDDGLLPIYGGGCKNVGPDWDGAGGTEPYFDHCAASELALPGGGCVSVGPRACDRLWNPESTADCQVGDLAACPDKWALQSDGTGGTWCEPLYDKCSEGELPVLGGGCKRLLALAEGCPEGVYPQVPGDVSQVLYVNGASSCESGCGSESQPYATLAQAVESASPGSALLVAQGEYQGALVSKPLRIIGVCPARVTITGSIHVPNAPETEPGSAALVVSGVDGFALSGVKVAASGPGVVIVDSSNVALTDVDLDHNTGMGLFLRSVSQFSAVRLWVHGTKPGLLVTLNGTGVQALSSSLSLEESLIEGNSTLGVSVTGPGATLTMSRGVVRDTQYVNGLKGVGVVVDQQTTAVLEEMVLERNGSYGAVAKNQSNLDVNHSVIRDGLAEPDSNQGGGGLSAQYGSSVALNDSLMHDLVQLAFLVLDPGSVGTIHGSVVRDIHANSLGVGGAGAWAQEGGSLVLTGSLLLRCQERAVYLTDSGATETPTLTVAGTLISATLPVDEEMGFGVFIWGGTSVLSQSVLSENSELALATTSDTSNLALDGVTIRNTQAAGSDNNGLGISVDSGAILEAQRSLVEGNLNWGVQGFGSGSSVTLAQCIVRDTSSVGASLGRGVEVAQGASLVMNSCVVEANREVGVTAGGTGSVAHLTDVVVRNTVANGNDQFGFGVSASTKAQMTLTRVLLDQNTDLGIQASVAGTTITVDSSVVRKTLSDLSGKSGLGLQATSGSSITLTDCLVTDNHSTGASAAGGLVTLTSSVVQNTLSDQQGKLGVGLEAQQAGTLTIEKCLVRNNRQVGVNVGQSGSSAVVQKTLVEGTQSDDLGLYGMGVQVNLGASLTLTDVVLKGNRQMGAVVGKQGSNLTAERLAIVGTVQNANGSWGQGLQVLDGASVTCSACLLRNNIQAGASAFGAGTILNLDGTLIQDTQLDTDGETGMGLVAAVGSKVTLKGTAIVGSNTAGLFATNATTVVNIYNSWIDGTLPGKGRVFSSSTGTVTTQSFGDGVLVDNDARTVVKRTIVRKNARTAVFYHAASGSMEGCYLLGNGSSGLALGEVESGAVTYGTTEPNTILGNGGPAIDTESTLAPLYICIPPGCTDLVP